MIQSAAGQPFLSVVENAPAGLVGTIGVTIRDEDGNVVTARSTAGITEAPAGVYEKTLTAPATEGLYFVDWDTGGASPTHATEELQVVLNPSAGRVQVAQVIQDVANYFYIPVVGATVHLYEHGTTTHITLYDDEFAGNVVSQPVTTDRSGRVVGGNGEKLYAEPTGIDILATRKTKTYQIYDFLGVAGGGTSPMGEAGGDLAGSYPNPRVGLLKDSGIKIVTPETYGAKGDGATDDTEAFRDALEQLRNTGGILLLGPKTYLVNGTPSTAEFGNAIIPLPLAGGALGSVMPYQFEYSEIKIWGTDGETVIKTTKTDGTYSATYGAPSVIGGPTPEQVPSPDVLPASLGTVEIDGVMVVVESSDRDVTDAAITAGQFTVTSAQAAFTAADVGKAVTIVGAGTSGGSHASVINSVAGGVATLADAAATTIAGAQARIGTGPTYAGVDLWYARACRTGRLRVHDSQHFAGDSSDNRIVTQNKWAFGFRTPNSFNFWEVGLGSGGVLHTAGFYVGVVLGTINVDMKCVVSSHTNLAYGLDTRPPLKHTVSVNGQMLMNHYKTGIAGWDEVNGIKSLPATDKFYLHGRILSIEQSAAPFNTGNQILDANNMIYGRLMFSRLASSSVLDVIGTVVGAANLDTAPVTNAWSTFTKGVRVTGTNPSDGSAYGAAGLGSLALLTASWIALGDANPSFSITRDGQLAWGPGGSSSTDVLLQRAGQAGKGILRIKSGQAGSSYRSGVGGAIFEHFTDVPDNGTNPFRLWTDTVGAGVFNLDGDKLEVIYHGITIAHATNTRRLQLTFGTNLIMDTQAFTTTAAQVWRIEVALIRKSDTAIQYSILFYRAVSSTGAPTSPTILQWGGDLTGLSSNAANDRDLKLDSVSSGAVQGVTGKFVMGKYLPAHDSP